MTGIARTLTILGSASGAIAVLLGAFGAHGLKQHLATLVDGSDRRAWWETAAHYHLLHAVMIVAAGLLAERLQNPETARAAGYSFALGTALFSGSLYAMTLTGVRALGAVTPFGGLSFIVGWALLGVAAYRG